MKACRWKNSASTSTSLFDYKTAEVRIAAAEEREKH